MIKLQIIGHIGNDCTQNDVNGRHVMNFNVAHSEKYKDAQGNMVDKTIWVKCAYWSDKTGIAQYLTKGKLVYVEGTPDAEAYMNKENQAASSLRLTVRNIQLLGGKDDNKDGGGSTGNYQNQSSQSGSSQSSSSQSQESHSQSNEPEEDLPF